MTDEQRRRKLAYGSIRDYIRRGTRTKDELLAKYPELVELVEQLWTKFHNADIKPKRNKREPFPRLTDKERQHILDYEKQQQAELDAFLRRELRASYVIERDDE